MPPGARKIGWTQIVYDGFPFKTIMLWWWQVAYQPRMVVCPDCEGEGNMMEGRLYPSGHTEVWVDCETCRGEGMVPFGTPSRF